MTRYAVYFAPEEDTVLARFGRHWLQQPAARGGPRHYGFHATLKAPFHLAPDQRPDDLLAALAAFARRTAPFNAPPLRLGELDGFLALRPATPAPALDTLAEDCLRALDRFRAPPAPAEVARRLDAGLNARQRELLARWGYPHVLDQYRFHMTLTERLPATARAEAHGLLAPLTAAFEHLPLAVRSVCLFVQPAGGAPFALSRRFPLSG